MDFDEYEYLEKAVEEKVDKKKPEEDRHRSHHGGKGEEKSSGRMDGEANGGDRREHRDRREREMDRRDRDEYRDKDRDRDRERRSSSRSRRHDREAEEERDRYRDRERRSSSRSRRHDRDAEEERERKSTSRSRRYEREDIDVERDWEREREWSRRSESRSRRHDREVEYEMERARSRDRIDRERELEREIREKDSRRSKEKKEAEELEADPDRDQRTVFAYQMPLKATERDVYEFFSQVGKVRDVRLIMDRISRRSKGVGYIEFYDVMSVQKAIQLSGQLLLGQPVMVKHSEAEKNLVQSGTTGSGASGIGAERKLYVGNLHFLMKEEQLRQIFEAFGPVELVQLPLDMETGYCKGFGFVQFAQLEHAKAAQQSLNGTLEIAGRIIKVSSVTEHVGTQDAGANAADFDDDDGGGLDHNFLKKGKIDDDLAGRYASSLLIGFKCTLQSSTHAEAGSDRNSNKYCGVIWGSHDQWFSYSCAVNCGSKNNNNYNSSDCSPCSNC